MPKQIINTEQIISDISEAILSTSTQEELSSAVWKICEHFEIENFVFGASLYNNLKAKPEICVINGYPEEWRKRYEDKSYMDSDLTVEHCKYQNSPIIWPEKNKKISITNNQIFSEASEFGLNRGISLPYHGAGCEFGMLSASVSDKSQESVIKNPIVQYAMHVLGASLFDFIKIKTKKENTNRLTNREKECLKWVAAGKTSWEASVIMGITERTVIFHVQNAASKMCTTSRTNAAVIALMNGEI